MTTIVAVHGTNDSGAAVAKPINEGQWWQRDSFFALGLQSLLKNREAPVTFEPLVWDGENSEHVRPPAQCRERSLPGRIGRTGHRQHLHRL